MRAFSRLLYSAYQDLRGMEDEEDARIGRQLRSYSDAIDKLVADPSDPNNRMEIDDALDTLSELGNFLGSKAGDTGNSNVCDHIFFNTEVKPEELRAGLQSFNNFSGFGLDVDGLIDGKVIEPTQEQIQERQNWRDRRAREREESLKRENAADEAQLRKMQQAAEERRQLREREEREEREREAAARRERDRQRQLEDERNKSELQRLRERLAAEEAARQLQKDRVSSMRSGIDDLLQQARSPQTPVNQKKASMAEAVAYHRELGYAAGNDSAPINMDRVNGNAEAVYDSAAFAVAEQRGTLDELAAMPVDELNKHILDMERNVGRYAEGNESSSARADSIFQQMNRTWRVLGNSTEFDNAKKAMQDVAGKNPPTQADNYLATETVQKYVAKNIGAAKSAVGMTRMACSLAFLKQTMTEEQFKSYCIGLNAQRHIKKQITAEGEEYDRTDPRCIVPDEIGTVEEVYHTVRERFGKLYTEEGYKMPSARDLATLTALKNLQARAGGDKNLVVEHEALQAEIEKVQADRRFQDAIHNRTAHELVEMAWRGNIDTIDGYAAPLKPEQQQNIQAEKDRLAQRKAEQEEQARRAREAEERRVREAEELRIREEAERQRQEQERIQKEAERAEFLRKHKTLSDLYKDLVPDVQKLCKPNVEGVFDIMEENAPHQNSKEELVATMVALGEVMSTNNRKVKGEKEADPWVNLETLKTRVEDLKKDPHIKAMGRSFENDADIRKVVEQYTREGQDKKNYNEKEKLIYPVAKMSGFMHNSYVKQLEAEKQRKKVPTVADGYNSLKKSVDTILNRHLSQGQGTKITAMSLALKELEDQGGINAAVDPKALQKRVRELQNDPIVKQIGQNLSSPFRDNALERAINMSENREQTVAKELSGMYQKKQEEIQMQQAAQKPKKVENPPAVQ